MSLPPRFEDLYPLLTLPRIPDLKFNDKIVISTVDSIESTTIDVGISKSIISSYIIKPTPKLIWSYALSPTVTVDCMDVYQDEQENKIYIAAITDRNKYHKVLIISRDLNTEDTEGSSPKTTEIKVSSKVKGIKYYNGHIVVVLSNGNVELYNYSEDELIKSENSLNGNFSKNDSLVYFEFINDIALQGELLLLISRNKSKITYKLISLNFDQQFFEINSVSEEDKPDLYFTYNSGSIYQLDTASKQIHRLQITNFKQDQSISVEALIDSPTTVSINSPASDRLLLSVDDKIHLISFKFSSLLDTLQASKVLMSQVVKVKGNTVRTTKSMLFYLNLKSKDNNIDLNVVNLNTGYNILSECLGKSINKVKNESFKGLVSLIDSDLEVRSAKLAQELQLIYETLVKYTKDEDVSSWEKVLVPYLKNTSWEHIQSTTETEVNDGFKVFDVETDRIVDNKFIEKVLQLIITKEVGEGESVLKFSNANFIPEFSLIYLLTNPLYPSKYTSGLLRLFNATNQINLLRQSIITCPNLPIEDLLVQLLGEEDSEIFQDLINRLINEYSISDITKSLKELVYKADDLTGFLNKLLNTSYNINNWYFTELLIDVGGLFNWTPEVIDQLNQLIEEKVQVLLENTYNLTLTKQALAVSGPIQKKHVGKKKNDDIIPLDDQQQAQLDSILTISNSSTNRKLEGDFKKMPTYSIEKLVL